MSDGPDDPLAAVRDAEAAVRPALADRLRGAVSTDPGRAADLRAWADGTDVDGDSAVRRAAARQAAVLTNHVRYRVVTGDEPPPGVRATPVPPFRGLDACGDVGDALSRLETRLEARDDVDAGLLGAGYDDALSDGERRTRGQYYTPPAVAELVSRWAVADAGEGGRVLDPAAGTGTFQLAALDALRAHTSGETAAELLSRLVAVDVDGVALHVAALRLAARTGGGSIDGFDRRTRSFFDLEPGRDVAPVDAVVGNPPFVRAGDLAPGRDHFRAHLDAYGGEGASPYADGDRALSRRCDASVYFVTHATRFLRPGGRLGMVLPAKWLESDYGAGFRRFLADQYDVRAVVGFDARAFDALVETVLLLAERRGEPDRTGGRPDVRFVRLDGRPAVGPTLDRLREGAEGRRSGTGDDRGRVVRRSQATFAGARQCSPYLRAPRALLDLLDHPSFVPLSELASVRRGVTTGANRFFLLDGDDRDRWGVDPRFLRPALRSIRGFDARVLSAADVEQSVLDVHGFLAERVDDAEGEPDAVAKDALSDAGHDALVAYVEHAEARGWHEGRTCSARRVWFDLGALPTPDAFVPKLVRERVFTVRNRARAVPGNAIDCLDVREGVDPDLLLGVLDSSLCRALMEVWGRDEAGLLQLMTYETRTLPVPDVRTFGEGAAAAVVEAAADLAVEGQAGAARGQRALDEAVADAVDVDLGADETRRLREALVRRRVDGGERIEVPVG